MKVLKNIGCGFSLSDKVYEYLITEKGWPTISWGVGKGRNVTDEYTKLSAKKPIIEENKNWKREGLSGRYSLSDRYSFAIRSNPELIEAVEKIGLKESAGFLSILEIVNIPDDAVEPEIVDDDTGVEYIEEKHRTW